MLVITDFAYPDDGGQPWFMDHQIETLRRKLGV